VSGPTRRALVFAILIPLGVLVVAGWVTLTFLATSKWQPAAAPARHWEGTPDRTTTLTEPLPVITAMAFAQDGQVVAIGWPSPPMAAR
jgi:hypothetical protein